MTLMADINKLVPLILKWEGGFANHPYDKGGATMKGVTIGTFRHFFGAEKTVEDLKRITNEQWTEVLRECFWKPWKADQIKNQSIANICVDFAWGSGCIKSVMKVQKAFGLTADGKVGPITLAVLNGEDAERVFETIKNERLRYVEAICKANPTQNIFLSGWKNRINDFKFKKE